MKCSIPVASWARPLAHKAVAAGTELQESWGFMGIYAIGLNYLAVTLTWFEYAEKPAMLKPRMR